MGGRLRPPHGRKAPSAPRRWSSIEIEQKLSLRISTIIPVLNEREIVSAAIERAWAAGADEVIVSDGGSTDGTLEVASAADCRVVRADPGRGSQMNAGAEIALGDVLLFIHADNWLPDRSCDQIRDSMEEADIRWGGFQQQIEDPGVLFRWIEMGNSARSRYQSLVYGDQGLFVARDLFQSLGGFAPLPLMEDFELSQRLSKQGRPALLPGPIHVSARRWRAKGLARQTLRNWAISASYRLGVSPHQLARWYNG